MRKTHERLNRATTDENRRLHDQATTGQERAFTVTDGAYYHRRSADPRPVSAPAASHPLHHRSATSTVQDAPSETLTLTLKPGHYSIICNLPGHYTGGMYTDLTVR